MASLKLITNIIFKLITNIIFNSILQILNFTTKY